MMVIRSFLIIVGNGHIMKGFYFAWLFYYILLQSAMRKRRGIIFLMLLQYINITYKAAKVELWQEINVKDKKKLLGASLSYVVKISQ